MDTSREQYLLFIQLLIKAIDGEKNIEVARKTLFSNSFLEPYELFKVLDREQKNHITSNDVYCFMKKYYTSIRKSSVDYAFEVMSKGSEVMTYDLFASLVTPRTYKKPFKSVYYLNKDSIHLTPQISENAAIDYCNLVKCIHEEYLNIDKCCLQLQKGGFTGEQAYSVLSNNDKGYLQPVDIQTAIEPYFHYLGSLMLTR